MTCTVTTRPSRLALRSLAMLAVLLTAGSVAAESFDGSRYLCWQLRDVLHDLRDHGLNVVYSSDLVRDDMQIARPLSAATPRDLLDQVLAPFDLLAKDGGRGVLVVVRDGRGQTTVPAASRIPRAEGVLPIWVEQGEVSEATFPGPPFAVPRHHRFLAIRIAGQQIDDWQGAAFELKNRILEARSGASHLKVALEGDAPAVARLVSFGLAPYVDSYVRNDSSSTAVPEVDATARLWSRAAARHRPVLSHLLEAGVRGDEVVILENLRLSEVHHLFLEEIQASGIAVLDTQPSVRGIDSERVRFFLKAETGNLFLALYAAGREQIEIALADRLEARLVFPGGAGFEFESTGKGSTLTVDGQYDQYLFELEPLGPKTTTLGVEVSDTPIVNPYEEVVENQVFRERQLERFESLDVMEYLSGMGHFPGADRTTWTHRIIQRKGRLTDYHHLRLSINGVPYPEEKLLKGRLFRSEALLQLNPLDVELDETYAYDYLGDEEIDGRPTYKIGFRPLRASTREDGSFVSGVVWLDQENHAHHRLRTIQRGIDGRFISQDRTYFYRWIAQDGQCWWDWTRRRGTRTSSSFGRMFTVQTDTVREDFKFNRPDIEQVVQEAYASDIMIHVETPPEGHRWLVKDRGGDRHLAGFEVAEPAPAAATPAGTSTAGQAEAASSSEPASPPPADYGDRSLADIHAFSTRTNLSLFGLGDDEDSDFYPGITISDQDFLDRGYQAFIGFFLEDANLGLSIPNFLRNDWTFSAFLQVPYSSDRRNLKIPTADGELDGSLEIQRSALALSLAMPLSRRTSLTSSLVLTDLSFDGTDDTDPRFVLPNETQERVLDLALTRRWGHFTAEVGYEAAERDDWQPWGIDAAAPLEDEYQVARASLGGFWRVGQGSSLNSAIGYWKGWNLDYFSRLEGNPSRRGLVGFGYPTEADEAAVVSLGWATHLWKTPVNWRLDNSYKWLDETRDTEGENHRLRLQFRFLINGPFKLDIWPSIRYNIVSSIASEEGEVGYGVFIRRRQ
ncbi:MAG: hypothetical protein AAF604_18410 [Acidobacteriota bacterium]